MANYVSRTRSNYFPVRDLEAFKTSLPASVTVVTSPTHPGCVALLPEYGWTIFDADADDDIDIIDLIVDHIQPGHVAICQEVGHKKMRYLAGWVIAVSSRGVERQQSIDIVEDLRAQLPEMSITRPEY